VDASCVPRLPITSLKRAFVAHSSKHIWLNPTEFRAECLGVIAYGEIGHFGELGGLLLFVQPAKAARCRRWFVKCSIVLDLIISTKGDDLVDVVRFAWKSKVLNPPLKYELTRNAFHRLDTARAKFLEYFLVEEHPKDTWVKKYLPPAKDTLAPRKGQFRKLEELTLELWHLEGDIEECQMCGFRPRKGPVLWETFYRKARFVFRFTRLCTRCNNRTMKRGLRKRPVSEGIGHWQTWDTAATTSTGNIGLELFGQG
jgi:hypothetical protein